MFRTDRTEELCKHNLKKIKIKILHKSKKKKKYQEEKKDKYGIKTRKEAVRIACPKSFIGNKYLDQNRR